LTSSACPSLLATVTCAPPRVTRAPCARPPLPPDSAEQEQTTRVFPPVAVKRRGGGGAAYHRQRRRSRPPRLRAPRRTLVRLRHRLHFKRAAQHARPPAAARRAVPTGAEQTAGFNPPPCPRTKRTRLVPIPALIRHAASLDASRSPTKPLGVAAGPLARSYPLETRGWARRAGAVPARGAGRAPGGGRALARPLRGAALSLYVSFSRIVSTRLLHPPFEGGR
jgi:hypothetical protein